MFFKIQLAQKLFFLKSQYLENHKRPIILFIIMHLSGFKFFWYLFSHHSDQIFDKSWKAIRLTEHIEKDKNVFTALFRQC